MFDFNNFVESGAFSGTAPTQFFISRHSEWDDRLAQLDEKTGNEVRKHLDEIHTDEELEIMINHYKSHINS